MQHNVKIIPTYYSSKKALFDSLKIDIDKKFKIHTADSVKGNNVISIGNYNIGFTVTIVGGRGIGGTRQYIGDETC